MRKKRRKGGKKGRKERKKEEKLKFTLYYEDETDFLKLYLLRGKTSFKGILQEKKLIEKR